MIHLYKSDMLLDKQGSPNIYSEANHTCSTTTINHLFQGQPNPLNYNHQPLILEPSQTAEPQPSTIYSRATATCLTRTFNLFFQG